jgi:hypothetical protein
VEDKKMYKVGKVKEYNENGREDNKEGNKETEENDSIKV